MKQIKENTLGKFSLRMVISPGCIKSNKPLVVNGGLVPGSFVLLYKKIVITPGRVRASIVFP